MPIEDLLAADADVVGLNAPVKQARVSGAPCGSGLSADRPLPRLRT